MSPLSCLRPAVLLLSVLALACGGGGGSKPDDTPAILTFTAEPNPVVAGAKATLTATFRNGSGEIYDGAIYRQVESGVPVQVQPGASTTYRLTVDTLISTTKAVKDLRLKVLPSAAITVSGQPNPPYVSDGIAYTASVPTQPGATFHWSITGGRILADYGSWVQFAGSIGSGTRLQCRVTGSEGDVADGAQDFTVVPTPSAQVTYNWPQAPYATIGQGGYAVSAQVSPGIIVTGYVARGVQVDGSLVDGTLHFTPLGSFGTCSVTINLSNKAGYVVDATGVIQAVSAPAISQFKADRPVITAGEGTALSYSFTGGQGVVSPGGALASGYGQLPVTPAADQAYTLTVTNLAGTTATAQASVQVAPVPVIQGFTSDLAAATPPGVVTLTPAFTGGTGLIEPGGLTVASGQAVTVQPRVSTRYILTVTNDAGRTLKARLVIHAGGVVETEGNSTAGYAIDRQGGAWSWGMNASGQLGRGGWAPDMVPGPIQGLTGVRSLVSSAFGTSQPLAKRAFCAALLSDGTVWTWGANLNGQLGDGSTVRERNTPAQVAGLSGIVQIAAGDAHLAALKDDGTVWTWGANAHGQLGTGDRVDRSVPVQVAGLPPVALIACAGLATEASAQDGTTARWGMADYHDDLQPVNAYLTDAYAIKGMNAWIGTGTPGVGALGGWTTPADMVGYTDGTRIILRQGGRMAARQYNPPTGFTDVAGLMGMDQVCANPWTMTMVGSEGQVLASGLPAWGVTGGALPLARNIPTAVPGLGPVDSALAGRGLGAARSRDGQVYGWGRLAGPLITNWTPVCSGTPAPLPAVSSPLTPWAFDTSSWGQASLLLWGGGSWWSWTGGQAPTAFTSTPWTTLTPAAAAHGGAHRLIVAQDGRVYGSGEFRSGQLGLGAAELSSSLAEQSMAVVPGLMATSAACGGEHSLVLLPDGTVQAFGRNAEGQLGTGSAGALAPSPVPVPGLTGVTAVAAGGNRSYALLADGTVAAWGEDLGPAPAALPGLAGVTALSAGERHLLALKADGTVWAWGDNHQGQLGLDTWENVGQPTQVPGLAGIRQVSAWDDHSFAVGLDGTLWVWGSDAPAGQLGLGRAFPTLGLGEVKAGFRLP